MGLSREKWLKSPHELTPLAGSSIGGRQETGERGYQGRFSHPQVAKHMFSALKRPNVSTRVLRTLAYAEDL